MGNIGVKAAEVAQFISGLARDGVEMVGIFADAHRQMETISAAKGALANSTTEFEQRSQRVRQEYEDVNAYITKIVNQVTQDMFDVDAAGGRGMN